MATPKKIWQNNTTGDSSKTVTTKSVVQEITIYNNSGSTISSFSILRIPVGQNATNPGIYTIKVITSLAAGNSVTLSNLRWVFDAGETLYIKPITTGLSYNIFVDGVEFE